MHRASAWATQGQPLAPFSPRSLFLLNLLLYEVPGLSTRAGAAGAQAVVFPAGYHRAEVYVHGHGSGASQA